jgi:hypothetical protein
MATHGSHDHGTEHAVAHVPGSMDISVQEKTFAGFVTWVKWGVIASILVLIFAALVNG